MAAPQRLFTLAQEYWSGKSGPLQKFLPALFSVAETQDEPILRIVSGGEWPAVPLAPHEFSTELQERQSRSNAWRGAESTRHGGYFGEALDRILRESPDTKRLKIEHVVGVRAVTQKDAVVGSHAYHALGERMLQLATAGLQDPEKHGTVRVFNNAELARYPNAEAHILGRTILAIFNGDELQGVYSEPVPYTLAGPDVSELYVPHVAIAPTDDVQVGMYAGVLATLNRLAASPGDSYVWIQGYEGNFRDPSQRDIS